MESNLIALKVNEYGDTVQFSLSAIRGDGKNIFWAAVGNRAFHIHRQFVHDLKEIEMIVSLIGDGQYKNRFVALHCQPCGLRLIIPENGMSAEQLRTHFEEWNSEPIGI